MSEPPTKKTKKNAKTSDPSVPVLTVPVDPKSLAPPPTTTPGNINPGDFLDLQNTVLQIPINGKFGVVDNPGDFHDTHFFVDQDHVVCSIDCGEAHSAGSHYPRTELNHKSPFDSKSKTAFTCDFSILKLPVKLPKVCFAQIKVVAPDEEIQFLAVGNPNGTCKLVFRDLLGSSNLNFIELKAQHTTLCDNVKLGDWFTMSVSVDKGTVSTKISGAYTATLDKKLVFPTATFKLGCYTQTNAAIEGAANINSRVGLRNLKFN